MSVITFQGRVWWMKSAKDSDTYGLLFRGCLVQRAQSHMIQINVQDMAERPSNA